MSRQLEEDLEVNCVKHTNIRLETKASGTRLNIAYQNSYLSERSGSANQYRVISFLITVISLSFEKHITCQMDKYILKGGVAVV